MASGKGAGKNWFGVQLEVTQRLLEAEERRLNTLGSDIPKGSGFNSLAQQRLQSQYEELNKEYENAATRLLLGTSRQRSNPTLGIRSAGKRRASIFDVMASREGTASPEDAASAAGPRGKAEGGPVSKDPDLRIENGRVKSGTLDALCNHFIPKSTGGADKLYTFTFLVASRLFVDPVDVLQRLLKNTSRLIEAGGDKPAVAQQCCRLLREWVETAGYDFRDERMHKPFSKLTELTGSCGAEGASKTTAIKTYILKKLQALEAYEQRLRLEYEAEKRVKRETISASRNGQIPSQSEKTIMDTVKDPVQLAQQLTFAEQERIGMIDSSEFIETFVESNKKGSANQHKVANIVAYIDWFNRLGGLVATEICRQSQKKKRVKVIEFWVEVGKACKGLRNYNSMMAIISALNMTSVSRMKKTWSSCKSKTVAECEGLENIMDPTGNFKNYRAEIASLEETDACIPFFSLLVKDMYFINEGAAAVLPNGHINYERLWPVSECLAEFLVRKQQLRDLAPVEAIQTYVRTMPVCSEAELFRCSVDNEPPSKEDKGRTMQRLRRLSVGEGLAAPDGSDTRTSPSASTHAL